MKKTELIPLEKQLQLISKAWGKQDGYCFFPWIRGDANDKKERILSYSEGKAYHWPHDRGKILAHLAAHTNDDVYWCPSLFEGPKRRQELAMDEHCLWADLDEVDPRAIDDYPPTMSWETSPGRYQAIWLISGGDMQGASWQGQENQALTYHLGADQSGWDTTQLLRIPGWKNHKPEYRVKGEAYQGLPVNLYGRRYLVDEFNDLPEVPNQMVLVDVLEDEIDRVDRQAVWGSVRLRVSQRVRELVTSQTAIGDRSDALWEIERELADAGCSVAEIVAIARATVWNKFSGRSDEIKRLTTEAAKAFSMRPVVADGASLFAEDQEQRPKPSNLFLLVKDLAAPQWLVRDVLTQGAVGFIAGQPKSFKSWAALDLALSVASGQPFLGHFAVENPGPVLYVQEEDSGPLVKKRLNKVWPGKLGDKLQVAPDGTIEWLPGSEVKELPPIDGYIGHGFTISDTGWQSWLDEVLTEGCGSAGGEKYRLLVFDPLMMMAGEVEENRAQAMTEHVFKPLKQLARKHSVAIQVVHHMKKSDPRSPQRGGQLLLGSVANHAWSEDSMYFRLGKAGSIVCEQESKNAPVPGFTLSHIRNKKWEPIVTVSKGGDEEDENHNNRLDDTTGRVRKHIDQGKPKAGGAKKKAPGPREAIVKAGGGSKKNRLLITMLEINTAVSSTALIKLSGLTPDGIYKGLKRAVEQGKVTKDGNLYRLTPKGKYLANLESSDPPENV